MSTTRKSLAYAFIDRYLSLAVSIGSSMVLARLLSPHDVGVFSVAMVVISLMTTLRDLGAGQYLVQEKHLTEDRIRAVWAIQLGLGVLMAAAVLAASYPASLFYEDARVLEIMWVLASGYLVNPLGSLTYSWLMREMRYDATAVMRLSANVAGTGASIYLAWRGHGAISLAWGNLVSTVVNALVASCYRPRHFPWWPGVREIRYVLSFGARITASSVASSLSRGAPEFLLGKFQDFASAGFYSRANGLVSMFNRLIIDAVGTVAISDFARQSRNGQDPRGPFLTGTAHVTALCWAFSATLVLLAPPVIRLLYGPQWEASADLTRWLAGALAFTAPVPLCMAALIGAGQAPQVLRITLLGVAVAMPLFLAAALHSAAAMGAAALACEAVTTLYALHVTRATVRYTWAELAAVLRRSLVVALAAAVAPALVVLVYGRAADDTVLALALGGGGAALGFVAGVFLARHPLCDEIRRLFALVQGHAWVRRAPK